MRKITLLLLLLLSARFADAQLIPVIRYYDSLNQQGIRETYQVLEQNPSVKQGVYRAYNRIGIVTSEIYYENGKESGKKIARDSATGLLRNIEFLRENGDYENYIFQFKKDGTHAYMGLIFEARANGFLVNELQLNVVDRLVNSLEADILRKGISGYSQLEKPIKANAYTMERIGMKDENPDTLLKMGGYLLYRYFSILENMDDLRANDSALAQFSKRIEEVYKNGIPAVYEGSLKYIHDSIRTYFLRDSIDDRYWRGFELMAQVRRIRPFCDSILILDSLIDDRKATLSAQYGNKVHYSVLYGKSILPVLEEINGVYREEDMPEERLRIGSGILRKSQAFMDQYPLLEKQRADVSQEYASLQSLYDTHYAGKFKQEFGTLRQQENEYTVQETPAAMTEAGNALLGMIRELRAQFEQLQTSDSQIEENFQADKAWYQQYEEKLYQNDFAIFEEKYLKYKEMEIISEKIEFAGIVLKDARFFHESIDSLKRYQYTIDSIYPKICEQYRKNYKEIYQEEIKPLKLGLTDYTLKTKVSEKRKKGKELSEYILNYASSFADLEEKKMEITALIKSSSDSYRGYFPGILKQEISGIKKRFDGWESCNKLQEKLQTGKLLRDDILLTDRRYDSIAGRAYQFKALTLRIRDSLKTYFPGIFEHEYQPLIDQYNVLDLVGTSTELEAKTLALRNKGNEMERNYLEIKDLRQKIHAENAHFNARIPKEREWSVILRRSRFHYYYFDKQIMRSESYSDCKSMQTELLKTLSTMNTLEHDKLVKRRKEFRKTRKPQEIRKLFLS